MGDLKSPQRNLSSELHFASRTTALAGGDSLKLVADWRGKPNHCLRGSLEGLF
jgi:hypothetical protein